MARMARFFEYFEKHWIDASPVKRPERSRYGETVPSKVHFLADEYTRGASMMSEARFVKFVKGRYWLTLTQTAEHPYKVFQDRQEAKVWLIQHGLLRSVAENCLVEAYEGISTRVVLSTG